MLRTAALIAPGDSPHRNTSASPHRDGLKANTICQLQSLLRFRVVIHVGNPHDLLTEGARKPDGHRIADLQRYAP